MSVAELLHHLEEEASEVGSGFVARVDGVGVALEQGVGVVDDLVVGVPVQRGHDVGHLGAVQLGEEEHLEGGDPQLGGVPSVGEDRGEGLETLAHCSDLPSYGEGTGIVIHAGWRILSGTSVLR